ncbi:MAG: pyridine nucleotide-disulfide oxidoreductase [Candidatus Binatia bacterium]|nr:MAG: pyridine nucleotide-disulfide oxidoreductase [Candidatus Binatia bacterium]
MDARYVLVGNSAASLAAVDWIRKYDREGRILLVNREPGPAYSRVALPYYVAGEMTLEDLWIRTPRDYEEKGVELLDAAPVVAVDPEARKISLADGRSVGYEKLLLATGSECVAPPVSGLSEVPVHYLWTLEDARGLKAAAEKARTGLVIGGGFIGMLAAEALRKLRIRLTIVEMAPQLLPQLLDEEGGKRFGEAVRDEGVTLELGTTVRTLARKPSGEIEAELGNGRKVVVDLVVVAAGVRPNLSCVTPEVCEIGRGILVDEFLRTSRPGIFAAGDVAEVVDFLGGGQRVLHAIWPSAVEQGRIAGANMTGRQIAYDGSLGMNVVELFHVTLAQIGRFREGPGDDVKLLGGGRGDAYRKIVVDRDGVVVGAMYLGDAHGVAEMGVVHSWIRRRARWKDFERHHQPRFTYALTVRDVPEVRT